MPTIFIDNKAYEVNAQGNLLEAALKKGLDLPYFCWHPALGSVGSCRQCAVMQMADENDSQGRMVMACMTPVKEGNRFSIKHPTCTDFRKSVIEWLMINHPHDCPVCDEGGECHLQDMTVMAGHNSRRYRFKKRSFRNQDLGPFINHEMNRCITCYRCVRFYRDVAGGNDLAAFANSGRVYFGRHQEGNLESVFSGNLAEVCPTGVFTDKVFHEHHIRKWDLATAPSICQLCSLGCSISPGERYGQLRRVQSRYNHDVNAYFLCDRGRFGHDFVNSSKRLLKAFVHQKESPLSDAVLKAKALLNKAQRIIGIGSSRASLESNFALQSLVGKENFYDADQAEIFHAKNQALALACFPSASLADIRNADAVFVIGEDLTNTAPMMALSIRQASNHAQQKEALKGADIAAWNDSAVRDFVRHQSLPVFVAHWHKTSLDDLGENLLVHPLFLANLLDKIKEFLDGHDIQKDCHNNEYLFIKNLCEALLKAEHPVLISGLRSGDPGLLASFFSLCELVHNKNNQAKFSTILPEAGSMGLALLKPKSLHEALPNFTEAQIDVAIVLESDLDWCMGSTLKDLNKIVKDYIVIDSLKSALAERAAVSLPCHSFFESTGTLVNNEGRLQRYFSVYNGSDPEIKSPWRLITDLMHNAHEQWHNSDDICASIAKSLAWPKNYFSELYSAAFTLKGKKIARQSTEFSGRTAINANLTMHEPKPVGDPDSPLNYSMEGARTKIPLPLVSAAWQPKWNSVQAGFSHSLQEDAGEEHVQHGVKLFETLKLPLSLKSAAKVKLKGLPSLYVAAGFSVFSSEERARYSESLSKRSHKAYALIHTDDAQALGIKDGAELLFEHSSGTIRLRARLDHKIARAIVLMPYGLIDQSLFFKDVLVSVYEDRQ
jgi:NADH-quinone oxidoreductase subunit G